MKPIRWDQQKNEWLKKERGISFEEIEVLINSNSFIAIIQNQNRERYPNQHCFVLRIRSYVYVIPFVEDDMKIFLKTAYPSRKMNRTYNKGESYE